MKRLMNMFLVLALAVSFAGCAGMANGMGAKDAGMQSGMGAKDAGMHGGMGTKDAGMVSKDAKVKCPKCGATFTVDEGQKALGGW